MTVVRPEVDLTGGRPVVPSRGALRPLGLRECSIEGGFWQQRQDVIGNAAIDHARSWMDKLGWTGNFTAVKSGTGSPERRGREFSDSEVYKLMEAMSWEVGRTGAGGLDGQIAELTGAIAGAQDPDGYLSTAYGRPGQRPRYSDLATGHELYCAGHLLQAAVARARTAGHDALLDVAIRAADHICRNFGVDGEPGICGHPEIEPALVELGRLTGDARYIEQAAVFIERRGHRSLPRYEHGWSYFSDDIPVARAEVLRGHAVRSLYLSSGAVDVAVETGNDDLLRAVARQLDRTLARRTYLTGGMGSRHSDEAFGDDFVLPSDRAYSETCAGVAAVMLAWRLLLATGEARYGDVIERILYNVVATAIADDGRSFFYAHTLHQRTPTQEPATDQELLRFGGGPRAPWFEVSCCLPNSSRLLASLSTYLVTADADGLQIHQYADASVSTRLADGRRVGLRMRTEYPDRGDITVRVTETDGGPWSISVRVPGWATGASIRDVEGRRDVAAGSAVVTRDFAVGDEFTLSLPMRPRWTFPDSRIDAVRGCVAAERGPVVLCAESIDQADADLDGLRVDPAVELADAVAEDGSYAAEAWGQQATPPPRRWPYDSGAPGPESLGAVPIRLVPYHRWARRGPTTMRVWLPKISDPDGLAADRAELP
jgi:DUF1680 family protein